MWSEILNYWYLKKTASNVYICLVVITFHCSVSTLRSVTVMQWISLTFIFWASRSGRQYTTFQSCKNLKYRLWKNCALIRHCLIHVTFMVIPLLTFSKIELIWMLCMRKESKSSYSIDFKLCIRDYFLDLYI